MMDRNEKCLAITDADFPRSAAVYAVVDAEEIVKMAAYYRVTVKELPAVLDEECGVSYATTLSEVERAFGDALEVILESGANYKFK